MDYVLAVAVGNSAEDLSHVLRSCSFAEVALGNDAVEELAPCAVLSDEVVVSVILVKFI